MLKAAERLVGTRESSCCLLVLLECLVLAVCPLEVRRLSPSPPRLPGVVLRRRRKLCLPGSEAVMSSREICLWFQSDGELACLECEGTRG